MHACMQLKWENLAGATSYGNPDLTEKKHITRLRMSKHWSLLIWSTFTCGMDNAPSDLQLILRDLKSDVLLADKNEESMRGNVCFCFSQHTCEQWWNSASQDTGSLFSWLAEFHHKLAWTHLNGLVHTSVFLHMSDLEKNLSESICEICICANEFLEWVLWVDEDVYRKHNDIMRLSDISGKVYLWHPLMDCWSF